MTEVSTTADRLRVAYVVHTFDAGGIERCVARLVEGLDGARWETSVICLNRSGTAARWIDGSGVDIVELRKRSGNDVSAVWRLAKELRGRRIDVVHSHNWGTLVETSLARRWAGTPVHVHAERGTVLGGLSVSGGRRWLRGMAMRWALNRADGVVSNSTATARRVEELSRFPASRLQVITNGVERPAVDDAERSRREIRQELMIGDRATVMGSIGRLVAVKNFGMAIEAVRQLIEQGVDAHLLLVGDGPEHASLQKQADEWGLLERVHLAGHQDDIGRWLAAMDVYFNCSLSEGMSQSLVEAMAAGLPLVVTDVGDSPIVVGASGECGAIVPSGDATALARALSALVHDRHRRERCGEASQARHSSHYGLPPMLATYENYYFGLMERAGRAGGKRSALRRRCDELLPRLCGSGGASK